MPTRQGLSRPPASGTRGDGSRTGGGREKAGRARGRPAADQL